HRPGPRDLHALRARGGSAEVRRPPGRPVVDVHSHFFPDRFLRALMREGAAHGARVEERGGERLVWSSPHQVAKIGPVLYDAPARLRLPVFTHPLNNAGEDRMDRWHLGNSVGNPGETALAAARLIMSGTLDRHPRLAVVLAHGGGSLPFIAARMDHAYEVRRECREAIAERPSSYLRRLYFDTITHGDAALALLIRT